MLIYGYVAESIAKVRTGPIDVTPFNGSKPDFAKLVKNNSPLFVPKVVGIYQVVNNKGNPESEEITKVLENMNHAYIEAFNNTGNKNPDNLHPDLIHIVYDPSNWGEEKLVREMLNDKLGRVSISTPKTVPDFSLKRPMTLPNIFESLVNRELDLDNQARELYERRTELYTRLIPLKEAWKAYGFSQQEYLSLFMMPD